MKERKAMKDLIRLVPKKNYILMYVVCGMFYISMYIKPLVMMEVINNINSFDYLIIIGGSMLLYIS